MLAIETVELDYFLDGTHTLLEYVQPSENVENNVKHVWLFK